MDPAYVVSQAPPESLVGGFHGIASFSLTIDDGIDERCLSALLDDLHNEIMQLLPSVVRDDPCYDLPRYRRGPQN